MNRPLAVAGIVIVAIFWVGALIVAPGSGTGSAGGGSPGAGAWLSAAVYAAGSLVCHQRPERSFHRGTVQMPVCARCLGAYAGGLIGTLAWAIVAGLGRQPMRAARQLLSSHIFRAVLVVAAMPTAISLVTAWAGWWDPENAVRAALAVPLGSAIGATVTAVGAGDLR